MQRYTADMNMIRPLLILSISLYALTASAQWQWLDQDGRKVFSDRPPPAHIPEKDILKRPRGGSSTVAAPVPVTPSVPAAPSSLDKALQDKRKQAEDAETAKRKAEEERNARIRAENCIRAQQAKASFDSGSRIARINEKGEREFMDEASLALENQRLQASISENCR